MPQRWTVPRDVKHAGRQIQRIGMIHSTPIVQRSKWWTPSQTISPRMMVERSFSALHLLRPDGQHVLAIPATQRSSPFTHQRVLPTTEISCTQCRSVTVAITVTTLAFPLERSAIGLSTTK